MSRPSFSIRSALTLSLLTVTASVPCTDLPKIAPATRADRALIDDLLVAYCRQLAFGQHDFSHWFALNNLLEVNGEVAHGK